MNLLREIYKSLPKGKNRNSSIFVRYFIRPISIILSVPFLTLNASPNAISYLAFLSSIFVLILSLKSYILGGIFLLLWLILDCVDGNIARYKKLYTAYGDLIDSLSSLLLVIAMPFVLGYNTYLLSPIVLKINMLPFSLAIGIVNSFSRIFYQKYRVANFENNDYIPETLSKVAMVKTNKKNLEYMVNRIEKNLGISGFFIPLMIIAGLAKKEIVFNLFYLCYYALISISSVIYLIYKINKSNRVIQK